MTEGFDLLEKRFFKLYDVDERRIFMKCEVIIDSGCDERVVIYAKADSPFVQSIKALAEGGGVEFLGYRGKEMVPLNPAEIYCVGVIGGKVYALCQNERFLLKQRLYNLEAVLPDCFVKINQSCIANINMIERFDASISGTLKLRFKNGYTDYVSRRQLKSIKERLGI